MTMMMIYDDNNNYGENENYGNHHDNDDNNDTVYDDNDGNDKNISCFIMTTYSVIISHKKQNNGDNISFTNT